MDPVYIINCNTYLNYSYLFMNLFLHKIVSFYLKETIDGSCVQLAQCLICVQYITDETCISIILLLITVFLSE